MDIALQLGQSCGQMAYTLAANVLYNTMSERCYSAQKEVCLIICFYHSMFLYYC